MNKKEVIKVLETIAIYLEIKGENSFKVSAYRKAANALESDERPLHEISDFAQLKGIGKGTAAVIEELVEKGSSSLLEQLTEQLPCGLLTLLKLPGLGGKKIAKLHQELNVINIETLKEACEQGKVQSLAGFGKKTEEKILEAILEFGKQPERLPIAVVLPLAEKLEAALDGFTHVIRYARAGSLRRLRETVKDLDYLIATDSPIDVRKQLLELDHVTEVISNGDTKVSLQFQEQDFRISIDFRIVSDEQFATALHHFTGSKDHNVQMRQWAKERGEKISEYGVENVDTNEVKTFASEEEFFHHFGLTFIPPEVREGSGEIEAWKVENPLISLEDIKGDLHMHTTWSDGAYSIEEMANAAKEKGYSYIAITDHSKYLKVANGLTEERLLRQHEEIKRLNEKWNDFVILTGVEMDILPDGTLDYTDDILENVDFVIASIHSAFSQDQKTIMKRLIHAMENPHVNVIAHPTGRLIGRREGYDVDMELLMDVAKRTNTALELNANPHRLDLASKWLKIAQDKGVKLTINTDAHQIRMLNDMEVGVKAARRGWVKSETVINTWPLEELLRFLKKGHF